MASLTRLGRNLVADFAVVALAAMLDATVDSESATSCSGSISHDPPITFLTQASELSHVAAPTSIHNTNR